jgi:hypothetical protein
LIEEAYETKVAGVGCVRHVIELFEGAAQREMFGPSSSPEESFAKRVKTWFNETTNKVNSMTRQMLNG